jgi:hypothetical protein
MGVTLRSSLTRYMFCLQLAGAFSLQRPGSNWLRTEVSAAAGSCNLSICSYTA